MRTWAELGTPKREEKGGAGEKDPDIASVFLRDTQSLALGVQLSLLSSTPGSSLLCLKMNCHFLFMALDLEM